MFTSFIPKIRTYYNKIKAKNKEKRSRWKKKIGSLAVLTLVFKKIGLEWLDYNKIKAEIKEKRSRWNKSPRSLSSLLFLKKIGSHPVYISYTNCIKRKNKILNSTVWFIWNDVNTNEFYQKKNIPKIQRAN